MNRKNRTRQRSQLQRRKGYAYRITEEDLDTTEPEDSGKDQKSIPELNINENVIDVEASTAVREEEEKKKVVKDKKRRSWKEREQAYEEIPPRGVQAWGPEGDVGMDIFTYAVSEAKKEISSAEALLEKRSNLASDAETSLIELKR